MQEYKVGEQVEVLGYLEIQYIIEYIGTMMDGDWYRLGGVDSGKVFLCHASQMAPILPKGLSPVSHGCECGAWKTTYPDDHMGFCPRFQIKVAE